MPSRLLWLANVVTGSWRRRPVSVFYFPFFQTSFRFRLLKVWDEEVNYPIFPPHAIAFGSGAVAQIPAVVICWMCFWGRMRLLNFRSPPNDGWRAPSDFLWFDDGVSLLRRWTCRLQTEDCDRARMTGFGNEARSGKSEHDGYQGGWILKLFAFTRTWINFRLCSTVSIDPKCLDWQAYWIKK